MCFWIPPLVAQEDSSHFQSVVIISPLLALMNQQAKDLENFGLTAQVISSETGKEALERVRDTEVRYVYLSPEQAVKEDVVNVLVKIKRSIMLVVVDEAHSIAQSSEEFRQEYAHLSALSQMLGVPTMALTATPTAEVRKAIPESLGLSQYATVEMSLNRPEIFIEVRPTESLSRLDASLVSEIKESPAITLIFLQDKTKILEHFKVLKNQVKLKTHWQVLFCLSQES